MAGLRGSRPSRTAKSSINESTRCTYRTVESVYPSATSLARADSEPQVSGATRV